MQPGEKTTDATQRQPFWSVMIPTFNPGSFLEQALSSILAQDPGPDQMQIAVVDDASTGSDPEPIVRKIAGDRVTIHRQPKNLGLARNWNDCIARAGGRWIHIMHQDDVVLPGYYESIRAGALANPQAGMAFTRCANFDEQGNWIHLSRLERPTPGIIPDWLSRLAINNRIQCPAVSVRADVYRDVGGFRRDLVYAIDWEMWCRIAAKYAAWFDPQIRMSYRVHADSETSRLQGLSLTLSDERRAIDIISRILPAEIRQESARKARLKIADRELDAADARIDAGDMRSVGRNLMEAVKTGWRSPSIIGRAMCVWARMATSRFDGGRR
ncbi:MAG TPA: glycosyltransferase [Tepidisphaeraceae bacterium]|nr:glycosyltransferase [Tepidisphaeraceae bacterium]